MLNYLLSAAVAAASLTAIQSQAIAQEWPTRPVTLVVPFTAGTTSDLVARAFADHLSKAIGQPLIIDNRGGAGGNIGAAAVAAAKPDGYTMLLATTGPAATNKFMYKRLSFDPQRDLQAIVLVGKAPVIIVGKASGPVNSLKELIDFAGLNPDKLTAGFPGNGTLGHITGKLLQQRAQIKFGETQYRGSTAIITDLLGGHIDLAMDSMAAYVSSVEQRKLRGLAIASAARFTGLPDVATVNEAGLSGFEASVWYALLAPVGTQQPVIAKINAALNEFLRTPQAKETFEKLGIEVAGGTPEQLKAFIASEIDKWGPIIKEANIEF